MTLKYERQWEIAEKIFKEFVENDKLYGYQSNIAYWDTRKQIIQKIFGLYHFVDWNILWAIFENDVDVLHLQDWEYQQKPFLDKMIEVLLWNKE